MPGLERGTLSWYARPLATRPPPPREGNVSDFFPVNNGVRQGYIDAPSLFNTCMDLVLSRVVDQSRCGASVGNIKIADLIFADDAVIFA